MFSGQPLHASLLGYHRATVTCRCSSATGGTASVSAKTAPISSKALLKAALTSGTLSLLGDGLAQLLNQRRKLGRKGSRLSLDLQRMARMAGFGLLFYGPFQCKWYVALDRQWPTSGWRNFLIKVTLNQVILSPIVLATVFSWNFALTGQTNKIRNKIQADMVPTMLNGWKFWVPAASVNFAAVPLQHQVLYMSVCSVLWTAYLSHSSNH